MKNIKIFSTSFLLLILWLLLFSNDTKAQSNVPVSLTVSAGTVSCNNDTAFWALGSVSSSFSAQYKTGTAWTNAWNCTDLKWAATWTNTWISVLMTNNLSWAAAWTYIANSNVTMSSTTPTITNNSNPACTAVTDLSTAANINTPKYVIRKTGAAWSVCTISSTPSVYVTIPGSTPVTTYNWTITVTYPS